MVADLPLVLVCIALGLHLAGERRAAVITGRPRSRAARRRALHFYAGLATIAVSLAGPVDTLAHQLFWVHMLQHVLLLTVAAPLIVLGAPWLSIWRPLPLGLRRWLAGGIARSPWCAPLRAVGRVLSNPFGALAAFSVDLLAWHIPAAYDATLSSDALHAVEHVSFMLVGILLWSAVLESPPLRLRLGPLERVYLVVAALAVGWVISLVLAFATSPLYPAYAHLAHRPGGISALVDQQLAAGMMLGPGSLTMTVFVFLGLYRWLGAGARTAT